VVTLRATWEAWAMASAATLMSRKTSNTTNMTGPNRGSWAPACSSGQHQKGRGHNEVGEQRGGKEAGVQRYQQAAPRHPLFQSLPPCLPPSPVSPP
jgi:hypothetical protein